MEHNTDKKKGWLGRVVRFAIPLIISVGLCWLLFRDFDFKEMWHTVTTDCDFRWILGGLALSVLAQVFRAMRWRVQLRAIGVNPPLFALVLSIFGTYAVNLVFPRLGEVWRTGYIAQRQRAPFTSVFGSMVADRLADTVTVALMCVFAFIVASDTILSYFAVNEESYHKLRAMVLSPWLWGAAVACVVFVWWFLRRKTTNVVVNKIQKWCHELWDGFIAIFSMPNKGLWLLLTVGIWSCYYTQFYLALHAFSFTAEVLAQYGWIAALVPFVLSSLSMGVPSNGGIGPWQWAVMFSLSIYGLNGTEAGTFANLQLGMNTLFTIILGLFTFICIAIDRHRSAHADDKTENKEIQTNTETSKQ